MPSGIAKQFLKIKTFVWLFYRELGLVGCASNLGISQQSLSRWQKELRESGDLKCRGSGNYSSDEAKEIARLKRELRDAKDALDVLKKAINILGE